jgi:hypothetical protein
VVEELQDEGQVLFFPVFRACYPFFEERGLQSCGRSVKKTTLARKVRCNEMSVEKHKRKKNETYFR